MEDDGQASVVVVLVIISSLSVILSLVVTSYVPAWMEDIEAHHMGDIENEFKSLSEIVTAQATDFERHGSASLVVSSDVTLGVSGVPIFTSPTEGIIYINSYETQTSINITDGPQLASSSGSIDFNPINRYFQNQHYTFESGVVASGYRQTSNFNVEPELSASSTGASNNETTLAIELATISADPAMVRGVNTVSLNTQVKTVQERSYNWFPGNNITITITSRNADAWARYYTKTLNAAGFTAAGSDFTVTLHSSTSCTVTINYLNHLSLTLIGVNVWLDA